MPAPRFYKVLRGERGEAAKNAYIAYLNRLSPTLEQSKVGQGGARPPSTKLYVKPFSLDLPATILIATSATTPAWTTTKAFAAVAARTKDAVPTGSQSLKLKGVKPARLIYRTAVDASGTATTSHLTGLRYLKYENKSVSVPFGKVSDTETYAEAVAVLKAINTTVGAIRFQDEEA